MATNYFVQSGATSDNCGGTDADDSLARSGTDGVSNSTTTFTSATAAFTAGDVGRGIWINTTTPRWRLIASVTNSTTVVLNTALTTTQSGLSWKIGGSWKTLAQLYSANGFASGDSAWAIGTFREVVTVAMTSAVAETTLTADPSNSKGFKNSSGVAISPGIVIWTGYLTNDTTAPSGSSLLNLAGRDFLTVQGFWMISGARVVDGNSTAGSTNITLRYCVCQLSSTTSFIPIQMNTTAGQQMAFTLDSCVVIANANTACVSLTNAGNSSGSDFDSLIVIKNSLLISGGTAVQILASGSATAKATGGLMYNNQTVTGSSGCVVTGWPTTGTTFGVYNNFILHLASGSSALSAGTSGMIIEDYNMLQSPSPRSNVAAGTHSQVTPTYAPMIELGQSFLAGMLPRFLFTPSNGSPLLGFGNQAGGPTVDFFNRMKAAGSASASYAVGFSERHDTGIAGGAANADAGNCLQLGPGPADHDFLIPVNAVATVISIKQKTASYGGTNYPQITLLANGELGVTTQTVADSSAHTSYTTLTLASFTPTKAGWVTLRLQNLTNDGVGIVYWDTATLPGVDLSGFDNYNRTEPFPAIDTAGRPILMPVEG